VIVVLAAGDGDGVVVGVTVIDGVLVIEGVTLGVLLIEILGVGEGVAEEQGVRPETPPA